MIVMKFGGTSVESAAAIERVAGIVKAREARRPVVVVSAMGKTTNKLLAIAAAAIAGKRGEYIAQLHDLRDFHSREARQVAALGERAELDRFLDEHFQELTELVKGLAVLGELTPRSIDAISSYGERLSSYIVTLGFRHFGLKAEHVDARDVMVTDKRHTQAAPTFPETNKRLAAAVPPLAGRGVVVMGGFIGSTEEGVTTTLGRGGSDFTASIVGAGIGAEEIQIWTDVDGMLTCDPTILPGGHRVKTISFAEAAELAYFGAKVLHPATVVPAMEKNIPVLILNSRRPEVDGTRIVAQAVPCANMVKSIACKRNITLVNIHSTRMLMAHGFLRRIFEAFDRYETAVDMVATTEVSVSLTIDNTKNLEAILKDLRQFAEAEPERGQAIVCLVGENIRYTPGVARRVFDALDGINVRMISQGASLLNLSVVIAEDGAAARGGEAARGVFRRAGPGGVRAQRGRACLNGGWPLSATARWASWWNSLRRSYGFAVALKLDEFNNANFEGLTAENFRSIDVAIDFSIPSAVRRNVEGMAALGVNLVLGTTGWLEHADGGEGGGGDAWHRAGMESELFGGRERVLPAGGGGGAGCWPGSRNTARGRGRFITRPRRTRLRVPC